MPQTPIAYNTVNAAGKLVPNKNDPLGNMRVANQPALLLTGITTPTIVKALPGRVGKVAVVVAGSAAGSVNNCLTTAAAAASNQIVNIPTLSTASIGVLSVEMVAPVGIVVIPGTGQTLSITYE